MDTTKHTAKHEVESIATEISNGHIWMLRNGWSKSTNMLLNISQKTCCAIGSAAIDAHDGDTYSLRFFSLKAAVQMLGWRITNEESEQLIVSHQGDDIEIIDLITKLNDHTSLTIHQIAEELISISHTARYQ